MALRALILSYFTKFSEIYFSLFYYFLEYVFVCSINSSCYIKVQHTCTRVSTPGDDDRNSIKYF